MLNLWTFSYPWLPEKEKEGELSKRNGIRSTSLINPFIIIIIIILVENKKQEDSGFQEMQRKNQPSEEEGKWREKDVIRIIIIFISICSLAVFLFHLLTQMIKKIKMLKDEDGKMMMRMRMFVKATDYEGRIGWKPKSSSAFLSPSSSSFHLFYHHQHHLLLSFE